MKKRYRKSEYFNDLKFLLSRVPAVHLDQLLEYLVRKHSITYDAAATGIRTIINCESVFISKDGYITDIRHLRGIYHEYGFNKGTSNRLNINMPLTKLDKQHLEALWIIILHYDKDMRFAMLNGDIPAQAIMTINGKSYEIISFTPFAEVRESELFKTLYTYNSDIRKALFRYAIISDENAPKYFPYAGFTKFFKFDKTGDTVSIKRLDNYTRDEETAWSDVRK